MSGTSQRASPRVLSRRTLFESPYMALVERRVELPWRREEQVFHDVALPDYVCMVAFTPDGRIPVVRQYRPAVECYTLELPAGTRDGEESHEAACRRELLEEAGLVARGVHALGRHFADTGRLGNEIHGFAVFTGDPDPGFRCESGMTLEFVSVPRLLEMIEDGRFPLISHVAAVLLALRARGSGRIVPPA